MASTKGTAEQSGIADDAARMKDEVAQDAERLKSVAADRVQQTAKDTKSKAMQTAKSTASALEAAASKLREDENAPSWLVNGIERATQSVQDFTQDIDNREPREIGQQAMRFANRSPGVFLAASACVGFAAARMLRAGAEHQSDDSGNRIQSKTNQSQLSGKVRAGATT